MLLNEHKGVQELNSTVAKQGAAIVHQQNDIASLTATMKQQVAQNSESER